MRIVYPTAPVTVVVEQSQPLTLECIVAGRPAPAAKWFKNGKEVAPGPQRQQQHNNLAFARVTRSDEGRYTCTAESEQGGVVSANYTVTVLGETQRRQFLCADWFQQGVTEVNVSSCPPQSRCLSSRVSRTSSSLPAPVLTLPAR